MPDDATSLVVCRFFDLAINRGNLQAADAMAAPHYVDLDGFLGLPPGGMRCSELLRKLRMGFSDAYYVVDEMVIDGECAIVRTTFQGTHDGDFAGLPPSGRKISISGVHRFRVAGGQLIEHRAFENVWPLVAEPQVSYREVARTKRSGAPSPWGHPGRADYQDWVV